MGGSFKTLASYTSRFTLGYLLDAVKSMPQRYVVPECSVALEHDQETTDLSEIEGRKSMEYTNLINETLTLTNEKNNTSVQCEITIDFP